MNAERFYHCAGDIIDATVPNAARTLTLATAEALGAEWNARAHSYADANDARRARLTRADLWQLTLAVEKCKGWRRAAGYKDLHQPDRRRA